jgi:hypothetical protein
MSANYKFNLKIWKSNGKRLARELEEEGLNLAQILDVISINLTEGSEVGKLEWARSDGVQVKVKDENQKDLFDTGDLA